MRPSEGTIAADRTPDHELLRQYVAGGAAGQTAFAELVSRHIDFVYSVAVRRVRDRHLAEDVAQAVFLVLAKKASRLTGANTILSNWLFCTTRYAAANATKIEARRRHYEREHRLMSEQDTLNGSTDTGAADIDDACDRAAVLPLLDGALDALGRRDREAVLLKYVEGRSHRDVGAAMGISEEAARKRIARAVERLRGIFAADGATLSVAAVASVLSAPTAGAAPAGLAGAITTSVAAAAGAAGGSVAAASITKATVSMMTWAKVKLAVICLTGVAVAGGTGGAVAKWGWPFAPTKPAAQAIAPAKPPVLPKVPAAPPVEEVIEVAGVIRTPDDMPAVGAEVFVVVKEDAKQRQARFEWEAAMMTNPRAQGKAQPKQADAVTVYAEDWPKGTVATDGEGRFKWPVAVPAGQPWLLLVRHASGFLQMLREEFAAAKGEVYLKAWGHISGQVLVGDKPQPNVKVNLFRSGSQDDWEAMQVRHHLDAKTDAEGKFTFKDVAPGEVWLSRVDGPRMRSSKFRLVDVVPGATQAVKVGGTGRPVIGRGATTASNAPNEKIPWVDERKRNAEGNYHRSDRPNPKFPFGFERMSKEEQLKVQKEFDRTPEGRLSRERQWSHDFEVKPDGSFRIDDLEPGKYQLHLRMFANENSFGEDLIEAWMDFEVPPIAGGVLRSDEPLDLGTVSVKLKPRLAVGKLAPDFAVKTLDGKPLKLSDYRGKYVVLKWWWNWSRMETEGKAIAAVYDAIKDDPQVVLITIGFDMEVETARKRVADHKLPGIHAHIARYNETMPPDYFTSPSTLCIIGPDGKVVAKNLRAENAAVEVAKVMLEKR